MWQFIIFLFAVALVVVAIKIAFLFLMFAGLIFKPKETLSLLFVLGILALLRNYPVACCIVVGLAVVISLARLSRGDAKAAQVTDQASD